MTTHLHPTQFGLINLKKDSRGRVRFSVDGFRFEVSKGGTISVYQRGRDGEHPASFVEAFEFAKPGTLRILAEAVEMATL